MTFFLANYLHVSDPDRLEQLRRMYPEASDLLMVDAEFGAAPRGTLVNAENREGAIALLKSTASKMCSDATELMNLLKARSTRIARMRLIGGVLAAISGAAGAFTAYATEHLGWSGAAFGIAVSAMAMIGGLTTVFADHFEKTDTGERYSPLEAFPKLVEALFTSSSVLIALDRGALFPLENTEIERLIQETDASSLEVARLKYMVTR